jgi:hypothetical protein
MIGPVFGAAADKSGEVTHGSRLHCLKHLKSEELGRR